MKSKKSKKTNPRKDVTTNRTSADPWTPAPTLGPADFVEFKRFRTDHLRLLAPDDPHETILAEGIITHRWFLQLADFAEAAILRDAANQAESPPVTMQDLLCPESAELKTALAEFNAPDSEAEKHDRLLAAAFDRSDLDKIHKFRKEHERALDRLVKEWSFCRRSKAKIDEEVAS